MTAQQTSTPVLEAVSLAKAFGMGDQRLEILNQLDLAIQPGETLALVGPSGCGKTTLLQILGLLDQADGGTLRILGRDASRLKDSARTALRLEALGFVYQHHHLLPECSALENTMLPMLLAGKPAAKARARALEILAELGLVDRAHHRPSELSGGQMQRVAIARALANTPRLLLADEPTGNLDPATAEEVMSLFLKNVAHHGTALLMVTHNVELAKRLGRAVTIERGRLVEQR